MVSPGQCVFGEEWATAPLLSRTAVTNDTMVLTFGLADATTPLGLSTCACLLARGPSGTVRPYTPISTNSMLGAFELMIKVYDSETALSYELGKSLEIGSAVEFKHIPFNVKVQYPFAAKHVGMIVGGTGVTPMIQALHALLGTADDTTRVTLLNSNKQQDDILARDMLERWAEAHKDRFEIIHTLTREPADSAWTGTRGRIGRELIEKHMPPPGEDSLIFVCGPPAMYDSLSGPRGEKELTGVLADIGYSASQVVKF